MDFSRGASSSNWLLLRISAIPMMTGVALFVVFHFMWQPCEDRVAAVKTFEQANWTLAKGSKFLFDANTVGRTTTNVQKR